MSRISVTLLREDGTSWFVGEFNSMDAANAWVSEEKTRPYWMPTTQVQMTDLTPPPAPPVTE